MKTVDKIIKAFEKTVKELEKTADKHLEKSINLDAQIEKLADERDISLSENKRAIEISKNLKKLIGQSVDE